MERSYSAPKSYDVFISFRGVDTRGNFTSHLHAALENKSIRTYIDYKLNRGDDVWPALSKAIRDSHVSLLVFSPNYAYSKWCLQELVTVMECRKLQGQVVIPVFYQTDPSHVRHQRGSYQIAFAAHERDLRNDQRTVRAWRDACTQAASIAGWDSTAHRDDSQVIHNIVKDVLQKLYQSYPNVLKGIVGIEETCKHLELLLGSARVIGIWGIGGIGKTTIAKALFAKLSPQYDSACFLENVREESKTIGLKSLREKLLSELLKEESSFSNAVRSAFIMRRLSSKKVFIVLDDVDSFEQLECLCGEQGDLGEDIAVIVTTRDRHLLTGRVDEIYEVKKWNYEESIELFCLNAFKKRHPQEGYKDLVDRAVHYAGGIPLALKVLGLHLHSRNREFWESTLNKLKKYPNDKILNVLKVSYDGLDDLEKKVFLDIAFFFNHKSKFEAMRILDACGFYATSGIEVLEDKALITIAHDNVIQMHDLLQEMGFEIVRKECNKNPGRHSRLRSNEAYDVLKNNKGTDEVEGIALDLSQITDLRLCADTFKRMPNLRFLQLYVPLDKISSTRYHGHTDIEAFSEELRYLEWNGFPSNSLPPTFCAEFLVQIRMPHSHVEELWQGTQDLANLERIELRQCKLLKKLPDLSKASKLKWLDLSYCMSLCDLHPSILSLDALDTLILYCCTKLKGIKSEKILRSLRYVGIYACRSLEEFSLSSDSITYLDLSLTRSEILHLSIGGLKYLRQLHLDGSRVKNLPDELSCLTSLEVLRVSNSTSVINKSKLHVLFDGLQSLRTLYLENCSSLCELPDNISKLSSLQELRLDGSSVEKLPADIKHLKVLKILSLKNCNKLQYLPELPQSVLQFHADNCKSLMTVSTLKTFAAQVKGEYSQIRHISFKNCMKLDVPSLSCIMEDAQLTMIGAACYNASLRRMIRQKQVRVCLPGSSVPTQFTNRATELSISIELPSYSKELSFWVCLPGSSVPTQFTNRTTESSICIKLPSHSNVLGFFFAVVLSCPLLTKYDKMGQIFCHCHCSLGDGTKALIRRWRHEMNLDLNSDHVFVFYDPFLCDRFIGTEGSISFEFGISTDWRERDDLIVVKECGVHPLFLPEHDSFPGQAFDMKLLGLELDMQNPLMEELMRSISSLKTENF